MKYKNLSFQTIKDKASAALLAAVTGCGIFQVGEDYGKHTTYRQLDYRQTSSLTDIFIQKSCPQLTQTELVFGVIKPEEWNIKAPAFSFAVGEISANKDILVLSQDAYNDANFVFIDSPGGSVSQTNDFLQQAKSRSKKIITIVDGMAASAAFRIAISGSLGYRLMSARSNLMAHEASVMFDGKSYQQSDLPFLSWARLGLKHTNEELKIAIGNASPLLSDDCINALVRPKTDTSITATDALKLGLIDVVAMKNTMALGMPVMVRKGDPREIVLKPN